MPVKVATASANGSTNDSGVRWRRAVTNAMTTTAMAIGIRPAVHSRLTASSLSMPLARRLVGPAA